MVARGKPQPEPNVQQLIYYFNTSHSKFEMLQTMFVVSTEFLSFNTFVYLKNHSLHTPNFCYTECSRAKMFFFIVTLVLSIAHRFEDPRAAIRKNCVALDLYLRKKFSKI